MDSSSSSNSSSSSGTLVAVAVGLVIALAFLLYERLFPAPAPQRGMRDAIRSQIDDRIARHMRDGLDIVVARRRAGAEVLQENSDACIAHLAELGIDLPIPKNSARVDVPIRPAQSHPSRDVRDAILLEIDERIARLFGEGLDIDDARRRARREVIQEHRDALTRVLVDSGIDPHDARTIARSDLPSPMNSELVDYPIRPAQSHPSSGGGGGGQLRIMPTDGGGNCLFHALVGAVRDLADRLGPGHPYHRFPVRLPMTHHDMRNEVVLFASAHREDPTVFFENSEPRNIAQMIEGDCNSHHGNDLIGVFRSVDQYFQACDHLHRLLSRN